MSRQDAIKRFEKELKKRPPVDLWEQMDQLERETATVKPPDSFTLNEYMERKGLRRDIARTVLGRLIRLDKIEKHKVPGSQSVYYTLKK